MESDLTTDPEAGFDFSEREDVFDRILADDPDIANSVYCNRSRNCLSSNAPPQKR